jgi:hypothetical protein
VDTVRFRLLREQHLSRHGGRTAAVHRQQSPQKPPSPRDLRRGDRQSAKFSPVEQRDPVSRFRTEHAHPLRGNRKEVPFETCHPIVLYTVCFSMEILKFLLDQEEAPIDAENTNGETALMVALSKGRRKLAYEMIRKGANVHLVDNKGVSALHLAVKDECKGICCVLLDKGVEVNLHDHDEQTPLSMACRQNWVEGVSMLLCYGADVSSIVGSVFDVQNVGLQEILFGYVCDPEKISYSLRTIDAAMVTDSHFFAEMFRYVSHIDWDLASSYECSDNIPSYNTEYLKMLMDKFEDLVSGLIGDSRLLQSFAFEWGLRAAENFDLLLDSKQMVPIIVKNVHIHQYCFGLGHFIKQTGQNKSLDERVFSIVSKLIQEGVKVYSFDMEQMYLHFGFHKLFHIILSTEVHEGPHRCMHLMPHLVYDFTASIEGFLSKSHRFYPETLDVVLDYFCHHKFNDYCGKIREYRLKAKLIEKIRKLPRVPLLVELARNVCRQYIIGRYEIRSIKQFHDVLQELSVKAEEQEILQYAKKIYNVN